MNTLLDIRAQSLDMVWRQNGKLIVRLVNMYEYNATSKGEAERQLYDLLDERDENINISHKEMPTWEQHIEFFDSNPYKRWHAILNDQNHFMGHIYLTHNNELGIFIAQKYHGHQYGRLAVSMYLQLFGSVGVLANINPNNQRSIKMFEELGFKHIQNTYRLSR